MNRRQIELSAMSDHNQEVIASGCKRDSAAQSRNCVLLNLKLRDTDGAGAGNTAAAYCTIELRVELMNVSHTSNDSLI